MEDEEDAAEASNEFGREADGADFDEDSRLTTKISCVERYDMINLVDNFLAAVKKGDLSETKLFLNAILDQSKHNGLLTETQLPDQFHGCETEFIETDRETNHFNFLASLDIEKVFCIAARRKHVEILLLLLKNIPFNKSKTGPRLLEHALALKNTMVVKAVLDMGVGVNERVNGSYIRWGSLVMYTFPLHVATSSGDETTVDMLVRYGAELDICDSDGNTALMLACAGSSVEVLRLLVKAGADLNLRDFNDRSALVIAATLNNTEMISVIVDHGGQISERMLLRTCEISSVSASALKLLLKIVPDEGVDVDWFRLLDAATPFRKPEIIDALLNHMPVCLKKPGPRAQDALTSALCNKHYGEQIALKLLEEDFIKVNEKNSSKDYPVHVAVQFCTTELFSALMKRFNADINIKDGLGRTPLMMCLYRRKLETYESTGRLTSTDQTAISIMENLIQQGADINAKDNHRLTSLHHAIIQDNHEAVVTLIKAGCNLSACDERGRSPLDIHFENIFLSHPVTPITDSVARILSRFPSMLGVMKASDRDIDIMLTLLEAGGSYEDAFCQPYVLCTLLHFHLDSYIPLVLGKGIFPQQPLQMDALRNIEINTGSRIMGILGSKFSAFSLALYMEKFDIALYLYHNWFLTGDDLSILNKNIDLREHILTAATRIRPSDEEEKMQMCRSLFLTCSSLQLISFVKVSDLIGPQKGRMNRLKVLGLPPGIQRRLLYSNPKR